MIKLTIGEVMVSSPVTVTGEKSVGEARELMYTLGIRHLPVEENGRCIGIVTDRDIKLAYAVQGQDASRRAIKEIGQGSVYTVGRDQDVGIVAEHLALEQIGCAVVEEEGRIVGIFTTVDACRVLADLLAGE